MHCIHERSPEILRISCIKLQCWAGGLLKDGSILRVASMKVSTSASVTLAFLCEIYEYP